jgi:CTP:molybdopterin cytidylyltransferase MocA
MKGIVPIILAGGASSRMGRPKALLEFDGKTCLELALEAMAGLEPPIVVLGPGAEEIRRRVNLAGPVAINPVVESGQTESLKAGLRLLDPAAEGFLFQPVDYPLVTRREVARLLEAGRAEPSKSIFIPSHRMRRGHPVLCRRPVADELLALPPGIPARAAIGARPERIAHVLFEEAYILMDMDTPEDYAERLAAYRARKGR